MYISPGIVVGFHGCDRTVFDSVVKNGTSISSSENNYDWLGHGVYFWEGSYDRALDWAKRSNKIKNPAVIGAFIKLGNCIDLLDSEHLQKIKATYQIYSLECQELQIDLPSNKVNINGISFVRELDCQVILRLQQINNELIAEELGLESTSGQNKRQIQNHPNFIDSVRGMFPEGAELYDGAGFRDKNHIQLCIINPNCIAGYFDPIQRNSWFKPV
ncbi:hypothetical protein [Providencia heimbachae]|uniref:Uncharacterized protein n=1 Tax=Providencia heimbachae ATCC 35613 TaxID=1354272 RepID=A0A1B7K452_9GAMM|nr:hypothetical protein [Providencia heimbachae]OAT54932.1 hypothetical protein M998_0081 [Providencia heimbachae ATCC 35613]QCJ69924.1 hypothetical protein C9446_08725 [Providencia heimbachae]SQH13118.1 Uncharacterised protein [Providencia heimbachae]